MSQSTLWPAPLFRGTRQVGFARLVAVEIRKLVDTRSSLAIFAVLAFIALALVVGLAVIGTRQGTPVTFTDQSTGASSWEFAGNGSTYAPVTPDNNNQFTHTFTTQGTFTPKLKVKRGVEENIYTLDKPILVGAAV